MFTSDERFENIACDVDFPYKTAWNKMAINSFYQIINGVLMVDSKMLDVVDDLERNKRPPNLQGKGGTAWHSYLQDGDMIQDIYNNLSPGSKVNDAAILADQLMSRIGLDETQCTPI